MFIVVLVFVANKDCFVMSEWTDISIASYTIKKATDVMGSQYVSYTVQSSKERTRHTVERRFSDFVLLQKVFAKEFPGAIVAPLPKEQVFGRFKQSFLESRMRGLREFLKQNLENKDIATSPSWTVFFTSTLFNSDALDAERERREACSSTPSTSWVDNLRKFAAPAFVTPPVSLVIVSVIILKSILVLLLACRHGGYGYKNTGNR